jgi:hypothetical protein
VHPDGTHAKPPEISVQRDGARAVPAGWQRLGLHARKHNCRAGFLAAGPGYDAFAAFDAAKQSRSNAHLRYHSDGRLIVFDRLRENSDILLIDLATKQDRS